MGCEGARNEQLDLSRGRSVTEVSKDADEWCRMSTNHSESHHSEVQRETQPQTQLDTERNDSSFEEEASSGALRNAIKSKMAGVPPPAILPAADAPAAVAPAAVPPAAIAPAVVAPAAIAPAAIPPAAVAPAVAAPAANNTVSVREFATPRYEVEMSLQGFGYVTRVRRDFTQGEAADTCRHLRGTDWSTASPTYAGQLVQLHATGNVRCPARLVEIQARSNRDSRWHAGPDFNTEANLDSYGAWVLNKKRVDLRMQEAWKREWEEAPVSQGGLGLPRRVTPLRRPRNGGAGAGGPRQAGLVRRIFGWTER